MLTLQPSASAASSRSLSFEVTQEDWQAQLYWQPMDFLVQNASDLAPRHILAWLGDNVRHGRRSRLSGESGLQLVGDAERDAMKPRPDGSSFADRGRSLGKHEESGLESVLGGMSIGEDAAADAKDRRPVSCH